MDPLPAPLSPSRGQYDPAVADSSGDALTAINLDLATDASLAALAADVDAARVDQCAAILRDLALLQQTPRGQCDDLIASVQYLQLPPALDLLQIGQRAAVVVVVLDGALRSRAADAGADLALGAGDAFGADLVLDQAPRDRDLTTAAPSLVGLLRVPDHKRCLPAITRHLLVRSFTRGSDCQLLAAEEWCAVVRLWDPCEPVRRLPDATKIRLSNCLALLECKQGDVVQRADDAGAGALFIVVNGSLSRHVVQDPAAAAVALTAAAGIPSLMATQSTGSPSPHDSPASSSASRRRTSAAVVHEHGDAPPAVLAPAGRRWTGEHAAAAPPSPPSSLVDQYGACDDVFLPGSFTVVPDGDAGRPWFGGSGGGATLIARHDCTLLTAPVLALNDALTTLLGALRHRNALDAIASIAPADRTDAQVVLLVECFAHLPLFHELERAKQLQVARHLRRERFAASTVIVEQNGRATAAMLLVRGVVAVHQRAAAAAGGGLGDLVVELGPGHMVGLEALVAGAATTAAYAHSVVSRTPTDVFVVQRRAIDDLFPSASLATKEICAIMARPGDERTEAQMAVLARQLRHVEFLSAMPAEGRARMLRLLHVERVPHHTKLFAQGDPGENFYIVAQGSVAVRVHEPPAAGVVRATSATFAQRAIDAVLHRFRDARVDNADDDDDDDDDDGDDEVDDRALALDLAAHIALQNDSTCVSLYGPCVSTVGAGATFGERALLNGSARAATVITRADTTLFVIKRRFFLASLRPSPGTGSRYVASLLKGVGMFRGCRRRDVNRLAKQGNARVRTVRQGELVAVQGRPVDALIIVAAGEVRLAQEVHIEARAPHAAAAVVLVDLATLGPGEVVGVQDALRADVSRTVGAVAASRAVQVVEVPRAAVLALAPRRALAQLDEQGAAARARTADRVAAILGREPRAAATTTSTTATARRHDNGDGGAPLQKLHELCARHAAMGSGRAVEWRIARCLARLIPCRSDGERAQRAGTTVLDVLQGAVVTSPPLRHRTAPVGGSSRGRSRLTGSFGAAIPIKR